MKPAWRYSDNRKRVLVYIDRGPHDAGIRIEMASPKAMAQHDVGSRVRSAFVARMKDSAIRRLHPQHVEVIP